MSEVREDRRTLPVAAITIASGVAATIVFFVVRHTLTDDVYITLSYARNLAFHLHWGLTPGETANSASSPLNVIVLGVALRLLRDPTWSVGVVFVSAYAGFGWCLARIVAALRRPAYIAILAIALVLLNPLLLSVVGMETTTLIPLILAILLMAAVEQRPSLFAVTAGLALMTRLDLVIFVVGILVSTPALRHRWRRVAALVIAVAAPWYVLSWAWLASAIPDTLAIKSEQTWSYSFLTGPSFYAGRSGIAVAAAFLPLVGGAVVLVGVVLVGVVLSRLVGRQHFPLESEPVLGLGLAGVAYWGAYVLLDPPPYLWYFGPTVLAVTISGMLLLPLSVRGRSGSSPLNRRGVLMIVAISALVVLELGVIADGGGSWSQPAIVGNIAAPSDYERIGHVLHRRFGNARIAIHGEIGAVAFFCECEVLDPFSDRGLTLPVIEKTIADREPLSRLLLRINYANLDRSQLPRRTEYYLDDGPEPPAGPNSWPMHVLVSGSVAHVSLRRNPADRVTESALSDQLVRALGPQHERWVLRTDDNFETTLYQTGLARALRERSIDVALHSPGVRGTVMTLVTGDEVDAALLGSGRSLLAYHGKFSLAERIRLARHARDLTRRHRAGKLNNWRFFFAIEDLRAKVRPEVVVLRGAR